TTPTFQNKFETSGNSKMNLVGFTAIKEFCTIEELIKNRLGQMNCDANKHRTINDYSSVFFVIYTNFKVISEVYFRSGLTTLASLFFVSTFSFDIYFSSLPLLFPFYRNDKGWIVFLIYKIILENIKFVLS